MLYQLSYTHHTARELSNDRDIPPAGDEQHTHPNGERNAECEPPPSPRLDALGYLLS